MKRALLLGELARRIDALRLPHPVRVAIDGVDGAGKTCFADELAGPLCALGRHVIRASVDDFHNASAVRYRRGRNSAEGYFRDSFDLAAVVDSLLRALGPGGSLRYRRAVFDYRLHRSVDAPVQSATARSVLLFHGVFLQRLELVGHFDVKLFLDVDFETSVRRMALRDGGSPDPEAPENARYVGGQRLYLRECDPRRTADSVIDHRDFENPVPSGHGAWAW